jgi:hypothetical protein
MFEFFVPGAELPLAGFAESASASNSSSSTTTAGNQSLSAGQTQSSSSSVIELECGDNLLSLNSSGSASGSMEASSSTSFTDSDGAGTFTIIIRQSTFSSGTNSQTFDSLFVVSGFTTSVESMSSVSGKSGNTVIVESTFSRTNGVTQTTVSSTSESTTSNSGSLSTSFTTSGEAAVNTTTIDTVTSTITSYSTTESETSVLTGITTSSSSGDVTETGWTTSTTSSTVEWPYSTFTTESEGDTVTDTVTASIITTVLTSTTELSTLAGNENCRGIDTVYLPSPCHVLYEAGPIGEGQVLPFCDVYSPEAEVSISQEYETSSTTSSSTASNSAYGRTEWSYEFGTGTTGGFPQTFFGTAVVFVPDSLPGFQPYYAMAISDDVYDSFTIDVATTLATTTPEYSLRSEGTMFQRGQITQVLTLNSNDTLVMGTPVGTTSVVGKGGYGWVTGDATVVFSRGVYNITHVGTDGTTSSEVVTYSTTGSTIISPLGEALGIIAALAVSDGGTWGEGVEKKTVVELACALL